MYNFFDYLEMFVLISINIFSVYTMYQSIKLNKELKKTQKKLLKTNED